MSFRLFFISLALLVAVPADAQTWQTVRVAEPRTGKIFLDENPHLALTGGSTTKAMTMHLVLKAIQLGKIKLSDTLTISAASVANSCTCWARRTAFSARAGRSTT